MIGGEYKRTQGIVTGRRPRMPKLGNIRLGIKVATGKKDKHGNPSSYPKDVPYFVFDEDLRHRYPKFVEIHGEEPTQMEAMIPPYSDNCIDPDTGIPTDILDTGLECYVSGGLACRGNGVHAFEWTPDGQKERACPCAKLEDKLCKPMTRLNLLFPDEAGLGGVIQITSTSGHNQERMLAAFQTMLGWARLIRGNENVSGCRVRISRVETDLPYMDGKTRRKSKHWLLVLEPIGFDGAAAIQALTGGSAPPPAALPPAQPPEGTRDMEEEPGETPEASQPDTERNHVLRVIVTMLGEGLSGDKPGKIRKSNLIFKDLWNVDTFAALEKLPIAEIGAKLLADDDGDSPLLKAIAYVETGGKP